MLRLQLRLAHELRCLTVRNTSTAPACSTRSAVLGSWRNDGSMRRVATPKQAPSAQAPDQLTCTRRRTPPVRLSYQRCVQLHGQRTASAAPTGTGTIPGTGTTTWGIVSPAPLLARALRPRQKCRVSTDARPRQNTRDPVPVQARHPAPSQRCPGSTPFSNPPGDHRREPP